METGVDAAAEAGDGAGLAGKRVAGWLLAFECCNDAANGRGYGGSA